MAVPRQNDVVFKSSVVAGNAGQSEGQAPASEETSKVEKTRTDFRETWIWVDKLTR